MCKHKYVIRPLRRSMKNDGTDNYRFRFDKPDLIKNHVERVGGEIVKQMAGDYLIVNIDANAVHILKAKGYELERVVDIK